MLDYDMPQLSDYWKLLDLKETSKVFSKKVKNRKRNQNGQRPNRMARNINNKKSQKHQRSKNFALKRTKLIQTERYQPFYNNQSGTTGNAAIRLENI